MKLLIILTVTIFLTSGLNKISYADPTPVPSLVKIVEGECLLASTPCRIWKDTVYGTNHQWFGLFAYRIRQDLTFIAYNGTVVNTKNVIATNFEVNFRINEATATAICEKEKAKIISLYPRCD